MDPDQNEVVRARATELARRLNLLQDWYASENSGKPMTFPELNRSLAEHGESISEGRWAYMLSGEGSLTNDTRLLTALAAVFRVDAAFLLDWDEPELPKQIAAKRKLVESLRANKLTRVAARSLGPLTAESLEAITRVIDSQMDRDFGKEP